MNATALSLNEIPAAAGTFTRVAGTALNLGHAPVLSLGVVDKLSALYRRQLCVGTARSASAADFNKRNENSVMSLEERTARIKFYTRQLAIAPFSNWSSYYDPFARIGLRLRMGMRAITRQRMAPTRVFS